MTNIEHELGPDGARTGRWRARQFYADRAPCGRWARKPPGVLRACEWREAKP